MMQFSAVDGAERLVRAAGGGWQGDGGLQARWGRADPEEVYVQATGDCYPRSRRRTTPQTAGPRDPRAAREALALRVSPLPLSPFPRDSPLLSFPPSRRALPFPARRPSPPISPLPPRPPIPLVSLFLPLPSSHSHHRPTTPILNQALFPPWARHDIQLTAVYFCDISRESVFHERALFTTLSPAIRA